MTNSPTRQKDAVQQWLSNFDMLSSMRNGADVPALSTARQTAIGEFEALGFPTTRHEEWKYTSLLPLLKREYASTFFKQAVALRPEDAQAWEIPGLEAHTLVFVNGHFDAERSHTLPETEGIVITSIASAMQSHSDLVEQHIAKYAAHEGEALTALNTAFSLDGAFVYVPKGKTAQHPVRIVFVTDTRKGNVSAHLRNLVIAEENSELRILESHCNIGEGHSFDNQVSEVSVARHARVRWTAIQNDSDRSSLINTLQARQESQSVFTSVTISTSGEIVRNNLNVLHGDQHCETHMYGLYMLDGKQHVDNHTLVDHAQPNCFSNELYKGVIDGESTAVFNGKVMVRQDAQKTNAFQSNKTILLSDAATINTKPQLEIFADDVKCSHGATTGQLDETALFYLRSRGVPMQKARALLTYAFATEITEQIADEAVREYVDTLVQNRLFKTTAL